MKKRKFIPLKDILAIIVIVLSGYHSSAQTNWVRCSSGLPDSQVVVRLSRIGTTLYAGLKKSGVYSSIDNGNSWQSLPAHSAFTQTTSGGIASIDTFLFVGQIGKGVLRTTLHGHSWTFVNSGLSNYSIQDLIAENGTLYAATYGGGVFYSSDLGESWNNLFANSGLDDLKVFSLASNSTMIFAGTQGTNSIPDTGVAYRGTIGGNAWTRINEGFIRNGVHLEQVFSMAANDSLVFAGTDDVGLFRSTDYGGHWNPVGGFWGDVQCIRIAGSVVYYGTSYGGVFRSLDAGQTWASDNAGLSFGNMTLPFLVNDFVLSGNTIYAATDLGIFKQSIPDQSTATLDVNFENDVSFTCFPNPFFTSTTFQFNLSYSDVVSLKIFDASGSEIGILLNNKMPAGMHTNDFDGSCLTAGTYVAVLQSNKQTEIIKFVKSN